MTMSFKIFSFPLIIYFSWQNVWVSIFVWVNEKGFWYPTFLTIFYVTPMFCFGIKIDF